MSYVGIDMSEVTQLAADFGKAAGSVVPEIDKVVEKGALNIKNTMVDDAASTGHYKHFSRSISYDRAYSVGSVAYEVGPDKGRTQGALGNILYFGTGHNGPVLDIEVGMRAEAAPLEKNIADVAEKAAGGRG